MRKIGEGRHARGLVNVESFNKRLEGKPGALVLCYLGLYSLGRFFVEGLRIDSLMLGSLRAAQVMSLLLVAASAAGLALLMRKR